MKKTKLIVIGVAILLIAGCNMLAESPEFPSGYCPGDNATMFMDWRNMTKLNDKPIRSEGHGRWVDIYVNELARDTYKTASAPYKECAVVVKPLYNSSIGGEAEKITIMVKMPAGYDPDNSDWWYGTYDAAGATAESGGKLESCIDCHAQVAETDYMFSESVMTVIEE